METSTVLQYTPTVTACFRVYDPAAGVPKQLESKLVPGEGCLITAEERGTEGHGEGKE